MCGWGRPVDTPDLGVFCPFRKIDALSIRRKFVMFCPGMSAYRRMALTKVAYSNDWTRGHPRLVHRSCNSSPRARPLHRGGPLVAEGAKG